MTKRFLTYSICFFSISDFYKICMTNKYGYENIIYFNHKGKKIDDPFSFYILDNITDEGIRNWKMDSRLEDFTDELRTQLINFLVSNYRKLYKQVFRDNCFHETASSDGFSQIIEYECTQIFQNLIDLGNKYKFNKIIRKVVSDKEFIPTENDRFNLLSDDIIQKKRFADNSESDTDEICNTIALLYDNIQYSDEKILNLIQKYSI